MFGGIMMKMTENEQKVARLYERYLYAKKRYEMGKTNKDYKAVMDDIRWQINEITHTNVSDELISLKYTGSKIGITSFEVILIKNKISIGKIAIKREGTTGYLNYSFTDIASTKGYELRAIKLLIEYMKKQGFETIQMPVLVEDKYKNSTMVECGGKKDLSSIAPYNEYTIKLK